MPSLRDRLAEAVRVRRPKPAAEAPVGLHGYERSREGRRVRFHLRVEPDGHGLLLADASAAVRLSPAGVWVAKGLLEGRSQEEIRGELVSRFRGARLGRIERDVDTVGRVIDGLVAGGGYPVLNLEDAAFSPHEARLIAPIEATLAPASAERVRPLLERLFAVGVPHVVFRTGDDVPAADLVRGVERAEDLGMIAGVAGRAGDLARGTLLQDLAQAGLDHATVLFASEDAATHDALLGEGDHAAAVALFARLLELEICPVAELPLVESTWAGLEACLAALGEAGVGNASFFAVTAPDALPEAERGGALPARALIQVATLVEEESAEVDMRFVWQPPVALRPGESAAAAARRGPRASGDVAVRIEADGAVIPPRGPHRSAGDLLRDSWEAIWGHAAFRVYRERVERPSRCEICPGLAICAPACPRDAAGWAG